MSETQLSTNTKLIHLAIGVIGWFLINGLVWLFIRDDLLFGQCIILPANILCLIKLAVNRKSRWVGLGILAAWVLNLILSLFLGIFQNGICLLPFYLDNPIYW